MRRSRFADRRNAGRQLAIKLASYIDWPGTLVLGLPRGGVVVAYAVAQALHAALDVLPVGKLVVPGQRELAMGALTSDGVRVLNQDVLAFRAIGKAILAEASQHAAQELHRQERLYRSRRQPPVVRERTVLVVDDGIATGATMRARCARRCRGTW